MALDEGSAFGGALFGGLDAAFPFENSPARKIVLSKLGKNGGEIDLAIAGGAEATGAAEPGLIAAVDALAAGGIKFGVFDVKHLDAGVVEINELEVIELLEDEVAGVEQNVGARMIANAIEEHFESSAVVKIFAGMNFEAEVHAGLIKGIEDGEPAAGEFIEGGFDEAGGTLGPGIDVGPGKCAGESDVGSDAEIFGSAGSEEKLLDSPFLAGGRVGVTGESGWSKAGKKRIVGGMAGDELALEVSGEIGDSELVAGGDSAKVIAVCGAFRGALEIEEAAIPGRDLHGGKTESGGPGANRVEGIKRRSVRSELREKDAGAFDGLHVELRFERGLAKPNKAAEKELY